VAEPSVSLHMPSYRGVWAGVVVLVLESHAGGAVGVSKVTCSRHMGLSQKVLAKQDCRAIYRWYLHRG
jgi:hypothetical protein